MNYIYTIDSWKSVSNMPENVKERFYVMGSETIISTIGNYKDNDVVLLFIPGNPGIIDIYDMFLEELYKVLQIPIVGISHGGIKIRNGFVLLSLISRYMASASHCSRTKSWFVLPNLWGDAQNYLNLDEQIYHKLEFIKNNLSPSTKLILVGHSIGTYVILKLMTHESIFERVDYTVLLFPTIENLYQTPLGRMCKPIANYGRIFVAAMAHIASFIPSSMKNLFIKFWAFDNNVNEQILKASHLLAEYTVANHSLYLVASEIERVKELDTSMLEVIDRSKHKIMFYYGSNDPWVPVSYYERIKSSFPTAEIMLCDKRYRHDFVFSSSKQVAHLCSEILLTNCFGFNKLL